MNLNELWYEINRIRRILDSQSDDEKILAELFSSNT